jgi:hypothetical protein
MKNIFRKLYRKLFNPNTGSFIEKVIYPYKGKYKVGFALYREYVYFGIPGHALIGAYLTEEEAMSEKKKFDESI